MAPRRLLETYFLPPAAECRPCIELVMGRLGPGGKSVSAYATAALRVTENKAEPWRRGLTCSSLIPGKSLG